MNVIPQPVIEALLVGIFIVLSMGLSHNLRNIKLSHLSNVLQDKTTYHTIVFWLILNCSMIGYVVSKIIDTLKKYHDDDTFSY